MIKLSVIIPSYKDPKLQKTIDSLLENSELGDALEIVVVLDGYWPKVPLKEDKRVVTVHLGRNRGMRGAINIGVLASTGEYLMRTDEHAIFSKGYDRIAVSQIEDNWIMTPRRYFLDVDKWEVMEIAPVDYSDLKMQKVSEGVYKFSGLERKSKAKKNADVMIDETMAMQGSCWFMKRTWWDEVIGELDSENYGPLYQDSHEMVFKTWKAGGKLMVNKNIWHAHKHRSFRRTHNNGTPENPSDNERCWAYSVKTWKDYFENEIKPKWNL